MMQAVDNVSVSMPPEDIHELAEWFIGRLVWEWLTGYPKSQSKMYLVTSVEFKSGKFT